MTTFTPEFRVIVAKSIKATRRGEADAGGKPQSEAKSD